MNIEGRKTTIWESESGQWFRVDREGNPTSMLKLTLEETELDISLEEDNPQMCTKSRIPYLEQELLRNEHRKRIEAEEQVIQLKEKLETQKNRSIPRTRTYKK